MYIVVKHQIRDSKAFFEKGSELVKNLPSGVQNHLFLPDKDMKSAVCLWEADSIDRVRNILDQEGMSSVNEYYEVDAKKAAGLERLGAAASR